MPLQKGQRVRVSLSKEGDGGERVFLGTVESTRGSVVYVQPLPTLGNSQPAPEPVPRKQVKVKRLP